jgi:hypothetical protein
VNGCSGYPHGGWLSWPMWSSPRGQSWAGALFAR